MVYLIIAIVAVIIIIMCVGRANSHTKQRFVEKADLGDEIAKNWVADNLSPEALGKVRRKLYAPKAQAGDPNAQNWMGFISMVYDKDPHSALKWYEQAAHNGNTEAMESLASGYSEDRNDPESVLLGFGYDPEREKYWYTQAAQAGAHSAQLSLALIYSIEGDLEQALYWYDKATNSKKCSERIKAYDRLAMIYGRQDAKYYDPKKQKECLFSVLTMRQKNMDDTDAYDEDTYASAAFSLGCVFQKEYRDGKQAALRAAVYCYSLAACHSYYDLAKEQIAKLPYSISQQEWNIWQQESLQLLFDVEIYQQAN